MRVGERMRASTYNAGTRTRTTICWEAQCLDVDQTSRALAAPDHQRTDIRLCQPQRPAVLRDAGAACNTSAAPTSAHPSPS